MPAGSEAYSTGSPFDRHCTPWNTEGKNPLQLDSGPPTIPLKKYVYNETRYTMLAQNDPGAAAALLAQAEQDVRARRQFYEHLAALHVGNGPK